MVEKLHTPLLLASSAAAKQQHYQTVVTDIKNVLQNEVDWVAAMATVSSTLHHAFEYFDWTGFYCVWPHTGPDVLVVGPYQGTLGCLRIPFGRGVCGAAAATQQTQLVPDVHCFEGHIACASSTKSEIVVPVVAPAAAPAAAESPAADSTAGQAGAVSQAASNQVQPQGRLLAVLDVDSDHPAAFDDVDAKHLEELCRWLAVKYAGAAAVGS